MPNDKQLTAMQELIERLQKAEDEANKQAENFRVLGLQATQLTSEAMAVAYSISRKHATELLQKEKEQMAIAYEAGCNATYGIDEPSPSKTDYEEGLEWATQTFTP